MAERNKDELEALAFAEYGRLLLICLTVRRLFDAAGLRYPEPLQRLGHDLPGDAKKEQGEHG